MKMKLILFFTLISCGVMAQFDVKKPCYEKGANNKGRFAEWECGKLAGVVDCNEKLTYDEDSKLVLSGSMGKPFTGTCETCHMNGLLERRITFLNGKENGSDTTKYSSGCTQVVRNHFQGQEHGQWIYYFDSTQQIAWEMNYNYGQKHGRHVWLTRTGDTSRIEHYNNGVLHGSKKLYYSKTRIEKEMTYVNGLLDGVFKAYTIDSILLQEINYKQGKKNGEAKFYYQDGKPLRTEKWALDVKDGAIKTFYYQGHLQTLESFKKGIPEGWWEDRWPDDKLKHRAFYKKGNVAEEYRYDEQGAEVYAFDGENIRDGYAESAPTVSTKKKKKKKGEQQGGGFIKME